MSAGRLFFAIWVLCAALSIAAPVGAEGLSDKSIPDFTVAISSVRFAGDIQWSYDRNMQATIDATAIAGTFSFIVTTSTNDRFNFCFPVARASASGAQLIVLPEVCADLLPCTHFFYLSNLFIVLLQGFFWWWMSSREEALSHALPFVRVVNYSPPWPLPIPSCNSHVGLNSWNATSLIDTLSCLAAAHRMFIVANIASSDCSSLTSPPRAHSSCALYNTAVVFSPNASIAATCIFPPPDSLQPRSTANTSSQIPQNPCLRRCTSLRRPPISRCVMV